MTQTGSPTRTIKAVLKQERLVLQSFIPGSGGFLFGTGHSWEDDNRGEVKRATLYLQHSLGGWDEVDEVVTVHEGTRITWKPSSAPLDPIHCPDLHVSNKRYHLASRDYFVEVGISVMRLCGKFACLIQVSVDGTYLDRIVVDGISFKKSV